MTRRSFPVSALLSLTVRAGSGSIEVSGDAGDGTATVEVTDVEPGSGAADRVQVDLHGTVLTVSAPRRGGVFDLFADRGSDAVDIRISVPARTPVRISSFTATVTGTGVLGTTDIAAAACDVEVAEVDGDLRVRAASGVTRIGRVTRSVHLRSGSGDACFGEVGGTLTCGSGSGRLEVERALGPVRCRNGSGTTVLTAAYADVDLTSGSGPLSIGVPAGHTARLDLTSGSGRVDSQLPIQDSADSVENTGRPSTIRARTGSGDITLLRSA